ncbi:class I SAM-dependent methyltransferase [Roseibium denhamense]|uniref:Methyltransferase domain-containing protein n=1 Tax=Roseibium denhamense TaxID=76305 RepID=A0ABY1NUD7_9HYPH|nr:class I SAM-dependent methyltransferase [Roseibium denhamense]MTI05442.1 class I SAM-dependent methyltransferase [Roseibium denhamense]SMP18609.1 Methyltransferase domain-containing protein [Roseibium denhamense]
MSTIFETLKKIGVASETDRELYSPRTRDRSDVQVYRDRRSGVIYIDGFYGGDDVYKDGSYRQDNVLKTGSRDYEITRDAARRSRAYLPYVAGRHIVDFGCGDGAFLETVRPETLSCQGVELQQDYVDALNGSGIPCHTSLQPLEDDSIDTVVSFHVLEHLPEPIPAMNEILRVLKPGGTAVIEVPHANDGLLSRFECDPFKTFTLWSQHLVLHTRESLRRLMLAAGFEQCVIEGIQRYPLSNHLNWLANGKPGGHKSELAALDTPALTEAYEAALNRIDATDTLVAIAKKPA